MIVELFGLPAAGKSTIAAALVKDGWALVTFTDKRERWRYFARAIRRQPFVAFLLFVAVVRHSGGRKLLYLKLMNLYVHALAVHEKARALPRALLDQGPHQMLLSLFESTPRHEVMRHVSRLLPDPDLLLVVSVPEEERTRRLAARGVLPRAEYGEAYARTFNETRPEHIRRALPLLCVKLSAERVRIVSTAEEARAALMHPTRKDVLPAFSYITVARMPTEKAHGISIAHMCANVAQEGYAVTLVIPTRTNTSERSIFAYYRIPKLFSVRRVPVFDFIGRGFTHPTFFFLQRVLYVLAVRCRKVPPSIVYTREPEIAAAFSGTHQTVYEAHRWPSGFAGWLTAMLVRSADLVVCNSPGTEAAARRAGIQRTLVAPNGFDSSAFEHAQTKHEARKRLSLAQDAHIALYIGGLEKWKGIETLLDASRLLTNIRVVIIGGSDNQVRELSARYPNVTFVGHRPYHELADNLAAADVLVLPNTAKDQESATFTSPIKLFGYLASGLPIVASDVPSVRSVLSAEAAFLVPPDDPTMLAQGIRDAIAHPHTRAKPTVEDYTWQKRAQRILKHLATIQP